MHRSLLLIRPGAAMEWVKEQWSGLMGVHKREALTQFVNLGGLC